ncbi:hypothetical protein [Sulfolobus tengchongensis spindle-shaped virus 4]|nr:hypothetical protein [Sulfolobus tengchongensis spindle-shaped virus 4]
MILNNLKIYLIYNIKLKLYNLNEIDIEICINGKIVFL